MIARSDLLQHMAYPCRITATTLEARLSGVSIGEVCHVYRSATDRTLVARAQVMVFNNDLTILSLIGSPQGLTRDMVICPTGQPFTLTLSDALKGAVVLPDGSISETFSGITMPGTTQMRSVESPPPGYQERKSIDTCFSTGIRAIDSMLPCGVGQRIGIFSAAGCGKTTLMHMLLDNSDADICVVALVGERGREVTEFIDAVRTSPHRNKCTVVYASSDFCATDRVNAAHVAMTIAEYFRDRGMKVLLFLDSVTRYARALRDVALSAGQLPARRGFPASVFARLPELLERPGATRKGSITAFFTVLLEAEDEADPVAEEVRSILDGHIYLSRKLARKNHYPAIDVLNSVSRVATRVASGEHQALASRLRELLARLEELDTLIMFGEYRPGENPENDRLFACKARVSDFLRQANDEQTSEENLLQDMKDIVNSAP